MSNQKSHHSSQGSGKSPLTHFICIPLITPSSEPSLQVSIKRFRDQVCNTASGPNASASENGQRDLQRIPPKAIRPVGSIHCTLGVMSLKGYQLAEAIELLNKLDLESLLDEVAPATQASESKRGAIKVSLTGMESMHDPQKTSILYIEPKDPTGRLYPFCLALQSIFRKAGLLVEEHRDLRLHATVVNMTYAKTRGRAKQPLRGVSSPGDRSSGHGPDSKTQWKFDATEILETFKDFTWVQEVLLDRIAICEMGAKKVLDDQGNVLDEKYTEVATIPLPC